MGISGHRLAGGHGVSVTDDELRGFMETARKWAGAEARRSWWSTYEELLSAAHLGIARARHTYDPTRGTSLKTHVTNCIASEFGDERRRQMFAHGFSRTRTRGTVRAVTFAPLDEADADTHSRDAVAALERSAWLHSRLERLTDPRLKRIAGLMLADLEQKEIGQIEGGISFGRVSQLQRRIVQKCRGEARMQGV